MNRKERIQAVLNTGKADRVPISLWTHFSELDQDPLSLAKATAAFVKKYDFDFVKMMPFALYSVQDYGTELQIYNEHDKAPRVLNYGIQSIEDYDRIHVLPGIQGTMGKQVEFARYLAQLLPEDTPFIQTIYSPLSNLFKMAGERLFGDLDIAPKKIHRALDALVETTRDFVRLNIEAGVSGFFFATQTARKDFITEKQFYEFEKPYDIQVIQSYADKTWMNALHLHGSDVYFKETLDYPVNIVNWHDQTTEPSLAEARKLTDKVLMGGIRSAPVLVNRVYQSNDIITDGTPEEVVKQIHQSIQAVHGEGLIISPGCGVGIHAKEENFYAARKAVEA